MDAKTLEQYYIDFREFKHFFVKRCCIAKKYEVYKVWAHWLIRNLCKITNNYHLIPPEENVVNDTDILTHLQDKCVESALTDQFYRQIIQKVSELYHKYNQLKIDHFNDHERVVGTSGCIDYEFIEKNGKQIHLYKYGKVFVKYSSYTHNRLLSRYIGDQKCFRFHMFEMGFNYYMLDGHSFQWCIPPKAFTTLEKVLSLKTEFFASPINATLPYYYSLFEVDKYFGAIDNFFNLDPNILMEGTYEINPPFIEYIFIESSKIVVSLLQNSQNMGRDLMFLYVMPNWLDSMGYQMLTQSGFLLDEIRLTEKNHFYHQSAKHKLISANFESHVLVVGTSLAKNRWNEDIKNKFIEHFTHY